VLGNQIEIGGRQIGDQIGKRPAADNGDGTAEEYLQAHEQCRKLGWHCDGVRAFGNVDESPVKIEKQSVAQRQAGRLAFRL
jgi:hypothetical protein